MALMMSGLYEALRQSGASDDLARKAAEEVATYDNRFAKLDGDLTLLKWMIGFNVALSAGVLLKMLA